MGILFLKAQGGMPVMLRAMILTLVMVLITLSAIQLGRDDQLIKALGLTKVPISPASESQPNFVNPKSSEEAAYVLPSPSSGFA